MNAPPGAQGAQIDIEAAYRCLKTLAAHVPYMAVSVRKGIIFDLFHPFGLRSAGGNLGEALDATLDIIALLFGLAFVAKWVDDIIPIRTPISGSSPSSWAYGVTLVQILDEMRCFGWPINLLKLVDFSSTVLYIGFLWDLEAKVVSLPERKRAKYLARVDQFLLDASESGPGSGATLHDAQKLNGTLVHVAFVYRDGRPYLPTLQAFLMNFCNTHSRFVRLHPSSAVITDLKYWRHLLSIPSVFRSLVARPTIDLDIWVDASTSWGIGLVVDGLWRAWALRPGWKRERRDIGWAESIALEFAIRHIHGLGITSSIIVVHSDNQGSIGQYRRGRGSNPQTNESIKRTYALIIQNDFDILLEYVESKHNIADAVSRGDTVALNPLSRLSRLFDTPIELAPFLIEHEL